MVHPRHLQNGKLNHTAEAQANRFSCLVRIEVIGKREAKHLAKESKGRSLEAPAVAVNVPREHRQQPAPHPQVNRLHVMTAAPLVSRSLPV